MSQQQQPDKIICSMNRVSKYHYKKPIIEDISLSYFYGAKIGVLGLNGAGKSTLLRIMAGKDKEYNGEVAMSPGYTVGLLEQEPELDDEKTVRQVVEEAVADTMELMAEYERINEQFAEPMSDEEMDKLIQRQAEVQEKLEALL
ncbi:MAG: ATP-binding cassette domain-containing protein, partial [Desulfobacterales bacterium]|nr:ATP-binding cassette domain-containing protein [Desulfobacterales bacterium]